MIRSTLRLVVAVVREAYHQAREAIEQRRALRDMERYERARATAHRPRREDEP